MVAVLAGERVGVTTFGSEQHADAQSHGWNGAAGACSPVWAP